MSNTTVANLTSGLTLQQKTALAKPLAAAFVKAMSNAGLSELAEIAKDKAKSVVISYFGFAGDIYEIAESVAEDGIGETLKGKLFDYFLDYTGLEAFKTAYEVLEKLDNGRSAMELARDPEFKKVIGKYD